MHLNSALLTQKFSASVAHRYWLLGRSAAENHRIYGSDASVEGIGSNLDVECTVAGVMDESLLQAPCLNIKNRVDHRCLFEPGHELVNSPSTLEIITDWLAHQLFAWPLSEGTWHSIRVHESPELSCLQMKDGERELEFKALNLTLTLKAKLDSESGLMISRDRLRQSVRSVFLDFGARQNEDLEQWGRALFAAFKAQFPELHRLRVDLARQEFLILE